MCRETREICWFLHVCGIITFAAKHPTLPGFIITLTQAVGFLPTIWILFYIFENIFNY